MTNQLQSQNSQPVQVSPANISNQVRESIKHAKYSSYANFYTLGAKVTKADSADQASGHFKHGFYMIDENLL